jgi:hypothetical protein
MNSPTLPPLPSKSLIGRVKHALRYRFSPSYRKSVDEAGEFADKIIKQAYSFMTQEREVLEGAWPQLGFKLKDEVILGIEVHLLWGLFNEVNKSRPAMPTSVEQRTMLHLMLFLMLYRDYTHSRAATEAQEMRASLDAGDRLATAVVGIGRRAATADNGGHLLSAVDALHRSGLNPDAYEPYPSV